MRHRAHKKRIGRRPNHRASLLYNLAASVILYERVKTTRAKAKSVRPIIEKAITVAKKKETAAAMRELNRIFKDQNVARKLIRNLRERYKDRPSGFLRLRPAGYRAGDAAPATFIELL